MNEQTDPFHADVPTHLAGEVAKAQTRRVLDRIAPGDPAPPLLTADQQRAIDQAEERAEQRRDEGRGDYASESEQDAAAAAFENALTRREP